MARVLSLGRLQELLVLPDLLAHLWQRALHQQWSDLLRRLSGLLGREKLSRSLVQLHLVQLAQHNIVAGLERNHFLWLDL